MSHLGLVTALALTAATAAQDRPPSPAELRAAAWVLLGVAAEGTTVADGELRPLARDNLAVLEAAQDTRGRIGLDPDPSWPVTHALATAALAGAIDPDHPSERTLRATTRALGALDDHLRRLDRVSDEVLAWSAFAARAARRVAPAASLTLADRVRRLLGPPTADPADDSAHRLAARDLTDTIDDAALRARADALVDRWPTLADDDALTLLVLTAFRHGATTWKRVERLLTTSRRIQDELPRPGDFASDRPAAARIRAGRAWVVLTIYYRYCRLDLIGA